MHDVVETYRTLTAYQDEGVVLSYWAGTPRADEQHFTTHFRKPADFRFEWEQQRSRSVVWSNRQIPDATFEFTP